MRHLIGHHKLDTVNSHFDPQHVSWFLAGDDLEDDPESAVLVARYDDRGAHWAQVKLPPLGAILNAVAGPFTGKELTRDEAIVIAESRSSEGGDYAAIAMERLLSTLVFGS